jgi:hypothetical protein
MGADLLPSPGGHPTSDARPDTRARVSKFLKLGLVIPTIVALLLYVGLKSLTLWREWQTLQVELGVANFTNVVGYPNIYWRMSFATIPPDWFRVEGESLHLWAGWDDGVGQHWFHLRRGEIDRAEIAGPMGRDVIHTIDRPWTEIGGGKIWRRIPEEAVVIGQTIEGLPCVYPMVVIRKVVAVNDVVKDHPYLVLFDVSRPPNQAVGIFDASVEGERVSLGTSGYSLAGKFLLYDRGSESLWVQDGDFVRSIAGKRKGAELRLVARPTPVTWSRWKSRNPDSRLVIGEKDPGVD